MSESVGSPEQEHEPHGPTIRDRRRIDPQTYQLREPQETAATAGPAGSAGPAGGDAESSAKLAELTTKLDERTADLQRLQAEYVNYKRRVDRDREVVRTSGIESVLRDLLVVLDDISSAREHEELSGGFKAVAEAVERIGAKYGLESYGTKGEPFDPHVHEALMHAHADGIDGPTCVEVFQQGYRIKDKILRPARVAVAEPDPEGEPAAGADVASADPASAEAGSVKGSATADGDAAATAEEEDGTDGDGTK